MAQPTQTKPVPEVISLGELLIDMVAAARDVALFDAPAFEPKPGGAPANVAVGVQRLGRPSAFVGKIGADAFGRGLRRVLDAEGVETRGLIDDPAYFTTLAFVALSDKGNPDFQFFKGAHIHLTPDDLDRGLIRAAKVLHFGSVSLTDDPARGATLEAARLARDAGLIISYDINWRPALWPSGDAEIAIAPMSNADLLKLNEAELKLVTGQADPDAGLGALGSKFPNASLIVLTLGEKGCMYRFGGRNYGQRIPPIPPEQVVDATGAGDAFMSAILAGLPPSLSDLTPDYLATLTRRACRAGAITTTRKGAIPALPRMADLID
jgi:fructokinase